MAILESREVGLKGGRTAAILSAAECDAAGIVAFRVRSTDSSPYIATSPGEVTETAEQQAEFIRKYRESRTDLLAVVRIGPGATPAVPSEQRGIIGLLSLRSPRRRKLDHVVDLGMTVDEAWRGLGVGRAMMDAALRYAREHAEIEKVTLGVMPANAAAVRLYESCGFVVEGVQRDYIRLPDGSYQDHVLMAVDVRRGPA